MSEAAEQAIPKLLTTGHPNKWWMLIAMCLAIFCLAFTTTAIMNALPALQHDLSMRASELQWTVNAYTLACAALIIVGGLLGDMQARRKVYHIGFVIYMVATVVIALCDASWLLILGRALQGVGAALITPTTLSMLKVCFPKEKVKLAISIWAGALSLGLAIGPLGGGFLVTVMSWRAIFWVCFGLLLIATIILKRIPNYQKELTVKKPLHIDFVGLVLFWLAIIPFVLGLVEGNTLGWSSAITLTLLIGGTVFFVIFCLVEMVIDRPLVHLHLFKNRIFVISILGLGITVFCLNDVLFFFNLFVQNKMLLHYTALHSGLALLPANISIFVLSFIVPFLLKIVRTQVVCVAAYIMLAVGFLLLAFVSVHTVYSYLWFPLLLIGLGLGATFTIFPGLGMGAVADEHLGEASGIINTSLYLFITIGIAVGTIVYLMSGRDYIVNHIQGMSLLFANNKVEIEKALMGHTETIRTISAHYPAQVQAKIQSISLHSAVVSFTHVMWLGVLLALLGAVLCFFGLRVKK